MNHHRDSAGVRNEVEVRSELIFSSVASTPHSFYLCGVTFCHSCLTRAISNPRTHGSHSVIKGWPAIQQRLAGCLSDVFATGKSLASATGKRVMGNKIRDAIRRVSKRLSAILVIRGNAALREQGEAECQTLNLQSFADESVMRIREQVLRSDSYCLDPTLKTLKLTLIHKIDLS